MSTPCYIAKQIDSDTYLTIGCQIEGHLHSAGYLLAEHYTTPEKVDELLSLGNIYSVESVVNPQHRNHGITGDAAIEMSIEEIMESENVAEYLYFFTQDNRWKYVCCTTEEMELRDVVDALQAENNQVYDTNDPYAWLKNELQKFLIPNEDESPTMTM